MKLKKNFYQRSDVVQIARELLGKYLFTKFEGKLTGGIITETEAYAGEIDRASHAFGGRRTAKNEHMYAHPGTAYVYICYGMHQMFNIVTNEKDIPDAVLIRAVEPLQGADIMLQRTGKRKADFTLTKGPGNVGKALGIFKKHSGMHLLDEEIYLIDDNFKIDPGLIGTSKRIGVESAFPDSELPYRFYIKGNKYVSGRNK